MLSLRNAALAAAMFVCTVAPLAAQQPAHWYKSEPACKAYPVVVECPIAIEDDCDRDLDADEWTALHKKSVDFWLSNDYSIETRSRHEFNTHPMYARFVAGATGGRNGWIDVPRFYVSFAVAANNEWLESFAAARGFNRVAPGIGFNGWIVPVVFSADNPEALIKILRHDASEHYWLFVSVASDLPGWLMVYDRKTRFLHRWSKGKGPAVALTSTRDLPFTGPYCE